MAGTGIELIDWAAPWCAPYRRLGPAVAQAVAQGASCAQALNGPSGADRANPADAALALSAPLAPPVCFVPQADLPEGVAYETHIRRTARVPTRDNLHDFFNGLCWWHFPATKRRLNQWQAQAIEEAAATVGGNSVRGPLRDALTLFDENAALLHAPEPLWHALRQRDWPRLFGPLRPLWTDARLVLFGHALLEKLVSPYKSITAHVLCLPMPPAGAQDAASPHPWDAWLAERLTPDWLAAKPYTPLPVLGVPGWWPANESGAFYDDLRVFRPPRGAQGIGHGP